jgi:dihydroxyacetone kinase-like protein
MILKSINASEIRRCFEAAAAVIVAEEPRLNALDSAIGDGDHGITMRIGFEAIRQRLSVLPESTGIGEVLKEAGTTFMGATGGAIGPLLGGMFRSGDKVLSGKTEMGPVEFGQWLAAMEASLSRMGKAKPGDKTILDAVHAACQAVSQTDGDDMAEAFAKAAEAATLAAQSTASMLSVKGRSSRLGERVLGHPDPGAVSFSLILHAFANCLKEASESNA